MSARSTTTTAREDALKALCECGLKAEAAEAIVDSTHWQDENVLAEMTADGAQFLHDYWVKNRWETVRYGCPNAHVLVRALRELGFRDSIVDNVPMFPGLPWFGDSLLGWVDTFLRSTRSYARVTKENGTGGDASHAISGSEGVGSTSSADVSTGGRGGHDW